MLALSCHLLLVRVPTGCRERVYVSPAMSAAEAGGALCRDKGSQSSLPLRPLDDFQITSLLEISLHFFWSIEQLKY